MHKYRMHTKYKQKGLTANSIYGIPASDETARLWEKEQKQLEKEGLGFKRVFSSKTPTDFDEGEMADISVITDATLDRDNEVVLPSGGNLDHFRKNPVIALNHNYNDLPIGRAAWIKQEPNRRKCERIKMKTIYAPRPEGYAGLWKPEEVYQLVKGGFLQGKSIGFIAQSARAPTQKEIDARPELAHATKVIDRWQLLEVSVATIPCNPTALVSATSKGIVNKSVLDELGIKLPTLEETDEILEEVWQWATKELTDDLPYPKTKREIKKIDYAKLLNRL